MKIVDIVIVSSFTSSSVMSRESK